MRLHFWVCGVLLSIAVQAQDSIPVQTDRGVVVGSEGNVRTFLGIPYAAAPLGDLRWKPPQPVSAWKEPRVSTTFGNVCPQVVLGLFPVPGKVAGAVDGDEDCLYLNVYAPRSAAKAPVIVWIHGGSFVAGAGSVYDGSVLAEKYGVVVVTLNYRLGALGFLALSSLNAESSSGSSGNYGLLDQQAALRWVRDNIAAFGGDPSQVTLAGESAGGMSVCAHLASPRAAGLFGQAIIQSGLCISPGNTIRAADAVKRNVRYAEKVGCSASNLACLRRVDSKTLLKTAVPGLRPISNLVWSPVYGTDLLPLTLKQAFEEGQFNRVPVLAGSNHDEGRLFISIASPTGKAVTVLQYWGGAGLLAGVTKSRRALLQYPYRAYGTPALAFTTMFTDAVFSCPGEAVNRALSKFVPVYAFEFHDPQAVTRMKAPADLPGFGSFHGSSLVYAFQAPITGLAEPSMFNPAQAQLAGAFSFAWAHFAKSGNPSFLDGPEWQRFSASRGTVRVFGIDGVLDSETFSTEHKCAFWSGLGLE